MTSPAVRRPCFRRWLAAHALATTACTLALAGTARAEEPTIDEVRYHPTELPPDGTRARLLLTGAALAVGWYGVAAGTSFLFPDAPNARDLRIPVVGPWMALGNVGCAEKERNCRETQLILRTALGVLSGVGQAGGIFALVEGLFLPTGAASTGTPRSPSAAARAASSSERISLDARKGPTWAAVPLALPDGAGLEIVGRF
jgi:hypothetical protein